MRQLSIQSINKFLENFDQNSLDTRSFSAIFQVPEVDNCAHNYQTRAANKSNLKEFSYKRNASCIICFFFVLVNRTAWKTPCAKQNLSSTSNQC